MAFDIRSFALHIFRLPCSCGADRTFETLDRGHATMGSAQPNRRVSPDTTHQASGCHSSLRYDYDGVRLIGARNAV